ncbi:MAG TPA: tetratricopeptide repeat protein [Candidatus Krumholzibacteria bacterium]|nr:tetratricopeptide repeat protein [Candidatus Krumholzibacteria bacterium]
MHRCARIVSFTSLLLLAECASAPPGDAERVAAINADKRRAAVQIEAGEYAAAVRTLESLATDAPRDDQVFTMLGDAQRGLGEFDAAIRGYEQAIRINYGDYLPHLKLGTWLMENGKTGRALTEFEVAVKFGNDDPLTHYNYGLALHELGRRDEALAQWRIARDLDPRNADIMEAVGIGLTGVDDQAAIASFADAEKLGKKTAAFFNNYALALERAGEHARAESYFIAAAAADDGREEYRLNLALHYMRVANYQDASVAFEQLIAARGARWSWSVYLARAYVELGRFDEALAALDPFRAEIEAGRLAPDSDRVDRVPPTVAEALSAAGLAWRGRREFARSRECLARAVALDPGEPSHLNNYGVVLAESGMLAEARAQWKRVLEIDPRNATARANLSAYER